MDVQMNMIDKHIGVWEGLLDDELCEALIQYHETLVEGGFGNFRHEHQYSPLVAQDEMVFVTQAIAEESAIYGGQFSHILNSSLKECAMEYVVQYPALVTAGLNNHELKIQKTKIGQGFHAWHCEDLSKGVDDRLLAYTFYLNDVEEGGETEFLSQGVRLKPTKGTLTIFPANFCYTHRGNPPISNDKYIVTGWLTK